jgi:AcrR family transcriptional regulator
VLTAYLDESYGEHVFVLVGLLVSEKQADAIVAGLDDVVRRAASTFGVSADAEVHAYDIMRPQGSWLPLLGFPNARFSVLANCVDVIAASGSRLFVAGVGEEPDGVRVTEHLADTYRVALLRLVAALDQFGSDAGERIVLVADEINDQDFHRRALREWHADSDARLGRARPGGVECTITFVDSRTSRIVQAADVAAYLLRRVDAGFGAGGRSGVAARTLVGRLASLTIAGRS